MAAGTFSSAEPGGGEGLALALGKRLLVEVADQVLKQAVPVDLGLEAKEHGAKTDGGAVHQDELARRRDAAEAAELGMDLGRDRPAIGGAAALLDRPRPVLHQGRIDEAGPEVEDVDDLAVQPLEAPAPVGADRQLLVTVAERP